MFNELIERGLVKQATNPEEIANILNKGGATFFIGFDPTATSLHVGHLLQIVTARRLDNAGHFPFILIGGATAQVGDPSGKSEMRKMLDSSEVAANVAAIKKQMLDLFRVGSDATIVNNNDWISGLNFLSFIRDIGAHCSVNNMLRADCFKSRMVNGLSVLEFNYMLLQAFDFLHLFKKHNCILQIGGDDQWSNILAGIDLIHKKLGKKAFGLTLPLLTTSTGQKMGKTEKGAVWLDKQKTSVFDFFQFWRNLPDSDVLKCFKLFTFLSLDEINSIPFSSVSEINEAKKRLAFEVTKFVHGNDEALDALNKAEALFESHNISSVEAVPIETGVRIVDLIIKGGFAKSKTEARNLLNGKGISLGDKVVTDQNLILTKEQFGSEVILRKGKKSFCRFVFA